MEPTECSETSAFNIQTPGKYPEENLPYLQHGECLKNMISQKQLRKEIYLLFKAVVFRFLLDTIRSTSDVP
jgi:hypothetical protein